MLKYILLNPLPVIPNFHFLRNMGLVKCPDVDVGLDLLSALSNSNSSDLCRSLFSQGCCHRHCCSQSQLPTPDNSFKCVQSFLVICFAFGHVEGLHFRDVFSLPSAVYLDQLVSIQFFYVALMVIIFSIRKEENLAKQASSKDSMTMNHEVFCLIPNLILIIFLFLFLFEDTISDVYFFAGLVLYHLQLSLTCVGNVPKGGNHSPWLRRGYTTSQFELSLRVWRICQIQVSSKCY